VRTDEWSALAANLCPSSGRRELAGFFEDFCEPVGKAVEATARSAVWQRPAKHLEHMLSGKQSIAGVRATEVELCRARPDDGLRGAYRSSAFELRSQ